MNKYIVCTALAAVVSSGSALASVARLEALGEDQFGSWYVDDNRNMFLNAAQVNNHNDFITMEWGDTTKRTNTEETPKAQGGIFKKNGNISYGVYFGADSNTASDLRAAGLVALYRASALGGAPDPDNPGAPEARINHLLSLVQNQNTLDLFIAGEGAVKWGARLSRSAAKNQQGTSATAITTEEVEQSGMLLGLGAIKADNEVYANIGLGNELKIKNMQMAGASVNGSDFHFKGKIGYQLGYIRNLKNNARAFVEVQQQGMEEKEISSLGEEWNVTKLKLGWGKSSKLNDKFTAFYKVQFNNEEHKNKAFVDGNDEKTQSLGATMGFEVSAREWLVFRGSVANNLMGNQENDKGKKKTIEDAVMVRLGAGLVFGNMQIDGLIGNDGDGDGTAGESADRTGTLRSDSLMSRVSLTYNF
jgi:hypothetical protein